MALAKTKREVAPSRSAALHVLREVRRGQLVDRAFNRVAGDLSPIDRRLAQELSYGTLRLRGRLDAILDPLVSGGLGALDPDVLDVLRIAAYQFLELTRVPTYAVVSEAVEQAREATGRGSERLVNAVLRRFAREGPAAPPPSADPLQRLTVWGSHPVWLVERWLARWPQSEVERLVEHNNRRPRVYLRILGNPETALERLHEAGIAAGSAENAPRSLWIEATRVGAALAQVDAVVQDPAASAVVDYMALDTSVLVADLCAAPGGKATLLAAQGQTVLALDISKVRMRQVDENRERLRLGRLQLVAADATAPAIDSADAVLLDAPCTGTGTLARHPDARWRLSTVDLVALAGLQRRMLDAAAGVVRPGGLLVYATCSLEPEENEEQVERFLARHNDYHLEPPSHGVVPPGWLADDGALVVTPQQHGFDGAYAARFRRRSD